MAYVKTVFNNQAAPAISAEELNKMGQGIADAHTLISEKIVTGTYTGNVAEGTAGSQNINLGFRPKAVFISASDRGFVINSGTSDKIYSAFALDGSPHSFYPGDATYILLEITATGFKASSGENTIQLLNSSGKVYNYIAFR